MNLNLNINFKDLQWAQLATLDFWFGVDRTMIHVADKLFLYAGALLIILGILVLIYARFAANQFIAKVALRISKIFITIGVLEIFWFLLRTQFVQVLGSKIVAAAILLVGLVWLYWPIKYLISHYEEDMAKAERAASREKYLNVKR